MLIYFTIKLLNEQDQITFNTKWRDARKIIADDEKFSKIHANERVSFL